MNPPLKPVVLKTDPASWGREVDRIRALLGAPNNPSLFPPHFLKASFPRIGGRIVLFERNQTPAAVGFLFPRASGARSRRFTLRFHGVARDLDVSDAQASLRETRVLGDDEAVFHDPGAEQQYAVRTADPEADLHVGPPDAADAVCLRRLQQEIWRGGQDDLYPTDIHSKGFGSSLSLVARFRGVPAGFLFGFYKFDGQRQPETGAQRAEGRLGLESQLLGVRPDCRGSGIGVRLKKAQAERARGVGIEVVTWTVDPLQFANARLNFSRLGAIAFDFHPDYYTFRNQLNRVTASRLGITWLLDTERVNSALSGRAPPGVFDLKKKEIPRLGRDWQKQGFDPGARRIALEVPEDWTAVQRESPEEAWVWRASTDRFFLNHLGLGPGQYVLTDAGEIGNRKFLIATRADSEWIGRLRT